MSEKKLPLPLEGIRVLDAATFLAAPFCAACLGEFGAEVIKVEQPDVGDPMRRFGLETEEGAGTMAWLSEARNKKSITLDLRQAEGAEIFKKLIAKSDVLVENFRPGTLEKWGLGYEDLKAINPGLVMLRISAYGQDGPYKHKPGFARIAHAFCGLANLAGEPGRPPVMPGSTSLADYTSGLWGAYGVMLALRTKDQTGQGQFIDIGLYESIFRMLDEMAPVYDKTGFIRERMGPDTVNIVPHSHYETKENRWIAIACSSDKMFERLANAMGRPELAEVDNIGLMATRLAKRDEVNQLVTDWTRSLTVEEILAVCEKEQVPCSLLYNVEDMFDDPQYAARENMLRVKDDRVGDLVVPNTIPRLSETPGSVKSLGPDLGVNNNEIYRALLGMDDETIAHLKSKKVI